MELGIYTFGELTSGKPGERMRDLIEEIELADQVGLDVFGVGEHHRPDFAVSSPAVVLAAAAERTRDIRLTSAVTVLSSDWSCSPSASTTAATTSSRHRRLRWPRSRRRRAGSGCRAL